MEQLLYRANTICNNPIIKLKALIMKTWKLLTLALFATFGFSSCDKEEDVPLTDAVDESYLVEVDIDGKSMILQEGKDGYFSFGSTGKFSGTGFCVEGATMIIGRYQEVKKEGMDLKKSFHVKMQRYRRACSADYAYVESLYQVGEHPFAQNAESPEATGVEILYIDPNGIHWSTTKGSQNQTGSHFELTSHQNIKSKIYKSETEAVFNCTLYNDAGEEIILTNGRIKARSVPYPSKYQ